MRNAPKVAENIGKRRPAPPPAMRRLTEPFPGNRSFRVSFLNFDYFVYLAGFGFTESFRQIFGIDILNVKIPYDDSRMIIDAFDSRNRAFFDNYNYRFHFHHPSQKRRPEAPQSVLIIRRQAGIVEPRLEGFRPTRGLGAGNSLAFRRRHIGGPVRPLACVEIRPFLARHPGDSAGRPAILQRLTHSDSLSAGGQLAASLI